SLQLVRPAILEPKPRASDEVLDRAGDQDLSGARLRRDARAGVHGDPRDLAVEQFALARVQPCAHLEPELTNVRDDRLRAADRPRRPVEAREEAVAGRVDLPAAIPHELLAHGTVMAHEQLAPGPVAKLDRTLARAGEVGAKHGREPPVPLPR